jgi:hypothetical protein
VFTVTANNGDGLQTLIEIDGPHPGVRGMYGPAWKRYAYKITEAGQPERSGEVHALPDEGLVRLIERISVHMRR